MEINNKEDSESFFEAEYELISPIEKNLKRDVKSNVK